MAILVVAMNILACLMLFRPEVSAEETAKDLGEASLEELGNVEVISVSKKKESLLAAPAAIFVLRGEAMQRAGFTTLPEALRMVPGLYVTRTDSHIWQVSTRGFSDLNNNKLLVLVDGRSVYTPELGSVFWDTLDIPLENIDRVEVIRGPGGTLWGANAVNGVINIVTKTTDRTPGAMVSSSVDLNEGYTTTVRYGGSIGSKLNYSVFGKSSYWEPTQDPNGGHLVDHLALAQSGLRMDWDATAKDSIHLEGGSLGGRIGAPVFRGTTPTTFLLKDDHVLLRWNHTISKQSSIDTMAYCDWYARYGGPGELRNTCDVEFQHSYTFNPRHSLIWGAAFLTTGDDLTVDAALYTSERRRTNVVSGFAQYEFVVVPDRLRVLAGSKLEHNDYTGIEYQPQVRAVWTPNNTNAIWGSWSRAVRTPSRNNSDLDLTLVAGQIAGLPAFLLLTGNPNLQSEKIFAYEAGYRYQPKQTLSFDFALFYNDYRQLIIFQQPPRLEFLPTEVILHQPFINGPKAESHGAELSVRWKPISRWENNLGVTGLHGSSSAVGASPKYIFALNSQFDLSRRVAINTGLYAYGHVPFGGTRPQPLQDVQAFQRVDVGATWRLQPQWQLGVWGRNLQSARHTETRYTNFGNPNGEVPRSLVLKLLWESKPEAAGGK